MKKLDTVVVTEHGTRLRVEKGALMVESPEGDKTRVPMTNIERVILMGRVTLSDELVHRLVKKGILVSSVSRNGKLRYYIGGPTKGNVMLRVAQIKASLDAGATFAISRNIVAGKIQSSKVAVQRWDIDTKRKLYLRDIADQLTQRVNRTATADDLEELRGIEGDAARLYFKAVARVLGDVSPAFAFEGRSRRPPRDPANALLSFTYGLAVVDAVGACQTVGLDDQVGFLHKLRPGRPSLALDLVEEARPAIADRFVVSSIRRRQLRIEHMEELPGGAWQLNSEGRKLFWGLWEQYRQKAVSHIFLDREVPVWSVMQTQALLLARHLRGDLASYPAWVRVH